MNIVVVLELLFATLIVIIFLTQILMPLFRGTPVFPIFRRERKLESELSEARKEVIEASLERRIKQEREKAERLRDDTDPPPNHKGGGAKG